MPPRKKTPPPFVKFPSVKKNPLLQGAPTLPLEGPGSKDLGKLSKKQQQDLFMSKWMEVMDPFERYKTYLDPSKSSGYKMTMALVKRLYGSYCLEGDWSEQKFVMVIDHLLELSRTPSRESLDTIGRLYDREELPHQRQAVAEEGPPETSVPQVIIPKRRRRI